MKFSTVHKHIKGIPFISEVNAKILYNFILETRPQNCLELGFAHGAASCYIAAALDEIGHGTLTSVDLISGQKWQEPSIEELLGQLDLKIKVDIFREHTGYNWFLHDEIVRCSENGNTICHPKYDFCIIDGPKNWTIDGCAFFLVDKLLKNNGWLIFDDYDWYYGLKNRESTDGINHEDLSEAELMTPQIKEVFHLLVMQHPSYHNFKIHHEGDWAWAQKLDKSPETKSVTYTSNYTTKDIISKFLFTLRRKLM